MFEDECQRASLRRRGVIARGVAKRCLVAFLAFAMAFSTTPAQLWAEGAEALPRLWLRLRRRARTQRLRAVPLSRAAPRFRILGARLQLVPPHQRQQLATKARRRGRALPRASSLQRHPLAKQDLPPRLPFRQRTRQKPAMSPRSKSRSRSRLSHRCRRKAQTWVAPTQLKLDEARRLRMPSLSCSRRRASRQTTIRTRHTVSTSKASHPRAMAVRLPSIRRLMPSGSCSSTVRLPRLARAALSSPRGRRLSLPIRLVARPLSLRTRLPQM